LKNRKSQAETALCEVQTHSQAKNCFSWRAGFKGQAKCLNFPKIIIITVVLREAGSFKTTPSEEKINNKKLWQEYIHI
jgi:hypothetical protein